MLTRRDSLKHYTIQVSMEEMIMAFNFKRMMQTQNFMLIQFKLSQKHKPDHSPIDNLIDLHFPSR